MFYIKNHFHYFIMIKLEIYDIIKTKDVQDQEEIVQLLNIIIEKYGRKSHIYLECLHIVCRKFINTKAVIFYLIYFIIFLNIIIKFKNLKKNKNKKERFDDYE